MGFFSSMTKQADAAALRPFLPPLGLDKGFMSTQQTVLTVKVSPHLVFDLCLLRLRSLGRLSTDLVLFLGSCRPPVEHVRQRLHHHRWRWQGHCPLQVSKKWQYGRYVRAELSSLRTARLTFLTRPAA